MCVCVCVCVCVYVYINGVLFVTVQINLQDGDCEVGRR